MADDPPYRKQARQEGEDEPRGFFARLRRGLFPTEGERIADRKRRAAEYEARFRGAPPSPVPWIADRLWAEWNQYAERSKTGQTANPIREIEVVLVTDDDRKRAPIAPVLSGSAVPPPVGTPEEQQGRLESTTGAGFVSHTQWPICCDRLATLLWSSCAGVPIDQIEAQSGPLDNCVLEAVVSPRPESPEQLAQMRSAAKRLGWERSFDHVLAREREQPVELEFAAWARAIQQHRDGCQEGINIFQCRSCGRVYGSYTAP